MSTHLGDFAWKSGRELFPQPFHLVTLSRFPPSSGREEPASSSEFFRSKPPFFPSLLCAVGCCESGSYAAVESGGHSQGSFVLMGSTSRVLAWVCCWATWSVPCEQECCLLCVPSQTGNGLACQHASRTRLAGV